MFFGFAHLEVASKQAIAKKQRLRAGLGAICIISYLILVSVVLVTILGEKKPQENPRQLNTESADFNTDSDVTPTIDGAGSNESVVPPRTDNDGSYELVGNSDTSVEVKVQSNEYLSLKEFGWFISRNHLYCVATITNKSDKFAVECPTFRVTAYNEEEKVLGTEEQTLSLIYPGQDFVCYCLLFEVSEKPNRIDVALLNPEDYFITSVDLLEHSTYEQMFGQNISVNSESVTGEIFNPNNYDIDSAMVTIVFRNNDGEIIFGEIDFINQIPAKGAVPFEIWYYYDGEIPSDCEVYAYYW